MKVYTISDRQLREFADVVAEEARRPLLTVLRNFMREMQAVAEDMAELRDALKAISRDDAPPVARRD
jgi:hypothetical protein